MRKKVDSRIRTLVENCVKTGQRSLFVIVGDKGRDQVGTQRERALVATLLRMRRAGCPCCPQTLLISAPPAGRTALHKSGQAVDDHSMLVYYRVTT